MKWTHMHTVIHKHTHTHAKTERGTAKKLIFLSRLGFPAISRMMHILKNGDKKKPVANTYDSCNYTFLLNRGPPLTHTKERVRHKEYFCMLSESSLRSFTEQQIPCFDRFIRGP